VSAKLKNELHARLAPVRARLAKVPRRRGAAAGLLAGALIVLLMGLAGLLLAATGLQVVPVGYLAAAGGVILAVATLLGAVLASRAGRADWHAAARMVDARYGLQGRTISTLEFLQADDLSDWQHLQVADTLRRLGQVDPRIVIPMTIPRASIHALPAIVAAAVLMILPPFMHPGVKPSDDTAAQAERESPVETPPQDKRSKPTAPLDVAWSPAPQHPATVFLRPLAEAPADAAPPPASVEPLGPANNPLSTAPLPAERARIVRDYLQAIRPTSAR